ncbi:hypothetical protein QIS99_27655 [Streptomyces sp. B-S-A8]|uniref:LPXTG cell wall anchor domain-containing protein n=1 Tax=Streptomyces solicavernae TaxID=3043614 RepID=A0ABT6RZT2_9ACTN|nr:hypothetical protein [Streptomyces sp. B-S-A8]MDI3389939.1 hypothetical protein [Streptomyces sp. B-S-A8]
MKLRRSAPWAAVAAATGALLCAAPAAHASAASGPLAPAPAAPVTVAVVAARSGPAEPLPPEQDSGTAWIVGAGALTLAVGAGMVAVGHHRPGRRA